MRRAHITLLALLPLLAACGGSDESTDSVDTGNEPADSSLVALVDDKHLQLSDNIVAVVREDAHSPALEEALNSVAEALTQDDLVALNKQALVDHDPAAQVAEDYATEQGLGEGLSGGSGDITIGAANFAENQVLAHLYEIVLDAAGFDASVKNVQSREVYEPALEDGSLDVMPEYAATLTEFLNTMDNGEGAEPLASGDIDETVAALEKIGAEHGLVPLEPAAATDQNTFAVRRDFAEKWGLTTVSDLAKVQDELVLGGPPECPERPFCQPGLEKVYGLEFADFVSLDAGGPLTRTAIQQGKVQVGLMFSSDPALAG